MNFQISNKIKSIGGSLLAAAVLLVAVFSGISSGQKLAEGQAIEQTANNTVKALQFFYKDQNHFPSALEFSDQNTMLNYLSSFPLPAWVSKYCSQSFEYKKIDANNFELGFCLPAPDKGYTEGWNKILGTPSLE